MTFGIHNLKGCFMFKLDIQFASDFTAQKKMNIVHMVNFGCSPKYRGGWGTFLSEWPKQSMFFAVIQALTYLRIYQQEWQVSDQTGI